MVGRLLNQLYKLALIASFLMLLSGPLSAEDNISHRPNCLAASTCAQLANGATGQVSPSNFSASPSCVAVTNSCGGTVMIPTGDQNEWSSFVNNRPVCLSVSLCPQSGVCGGGAFTCAVGSAFSDANSGLNDYWYCSGLYGGANSGLCSYAIPQNGQCAGGAAWACAAGSAFGQWSDGNNDYWQCGGQNGGSDSGPCSFAIPVDGSCGGGAYTCNQGSAINQAGDSSVQYWQCSGNNGGNASGQCVSHADPGIVCGGLNTYYGGGDNTSAVYSGTCNIGSASAVSISSTSGAGGCMDLTNTDVASWVCSASDGVALNTCSVTNTYCTSGGNDVGNH